MIGPLLGLGGIACVVLTSEFLWHKGWVHRAETARKFVHILTGVFMAFWPFFMSFSMIQLLSLALVVLVFLSKELRLFRSIHGVSRLTYGEILFPLGIFVSATFTRSEWAYTAAVLHLSLADGFAATVGVRHLKRFSYTVLGQTKTVIGTFTFFVVSLFVTLAVVVFDSADYGVTAQTIILCLPVAATLVENFAVYGTDNILVPLVVIGILNAFQVVT